MKQSPMYLGLIFLFLFGILCASPLEGESQRNSYWVFFSDKGIESASPHRALNEARSKLNPHARWRRAKVLPNLVDELDLPVSQAHLAEVSACGARQRVASRWLNAVSVEADSESLERIRALPFVREVRPVARYWPTHRHLETTEVKIKEKQRDPWHFDDFDYGPSLTQLELCRVPEMHARGLTGRGVRLCLLDTGFWLTHEVFDSSNIIATYDFINGDSIVWNEPDQDTIIQHDHGTITLSVAAGRRDGSLYGPAFGAELLLGKTEDVRSETPVEEDYYVAGLEWADDWGADVVSTSLGYLDWYTFEDMDGNTAVTTIAVDIAVSRGIVVCTAAGNERQEEWGHIIAPADADSVLAIGAVDSAGEIAYFSSPGPTADGRIKPELCASGHGTYAAIPWFGPDGYVRASGTSLSTPIIGGICALLLEAHPDWTPMQLREALLMTASQAAAPDTDYGWGIADGLAALDYVSATPHFRAVPHQKIFISAFPNPANSTTIWTLEIPEGLVGSFTITDILGRRISYIPEKRWAVGQHRIPFELSDLPSGTYFGRFATAAGQSVVRIAVVK